MAGPREELPQVGPASRLLGLHPATIRNWAKKGKLPVVWVGRERRFRVSAIKSFLRREEASADPGGDDRVVGYVRVSGSTGQDQPPRFSLLLCTR